MKILLLLVVMLLVCSVRAETVVLLSGKTLDGVILKQTDEAVTLRTLQGTVELRRSDIQEIRQDTPKVESTPSDRETIRKIAGVTKFADLSEKPSKCPKCTGTGIAIWLECLNCNKSGKSGYKNMGDYWEMCKRCTGAGRIAAARCNTCTGTGSVLLSKLEPSAGGFKEPPKGTKWCDGCSGTGAAIWTDCSQCKRSKFPGYLFHGDSVTLCNRCNGAGKFPSLACGKCKQKGVLPLGN